MHSKLGSLAIKYASDKYYKHSYIPVYEKLFENFTPKYVLEIGIGYPELMQRQLPKEVQYIIGSSLFMWREYWPDAFILGVDIKKEITELKGWPPGVATITVDQSSAGELIDLGNCQGPFDLIIDDGSHNKYHQYTSASALLPFVRAGGIYIIEDVLPEVGKELAANLGGEFIPLGKTWDDNLVVIRK